MKKNIMTPFNSEKNPIRSQKSDSNIIKSSIKSKENKRVSLHFKKSYSEHIFPSNTLNKNPTQNKESLNISSKLSDFNSPEEKRFDFCRKMKKILKGKVFSIIIIIAIFTLLFLEEFKVLVIDHKYDVVVDSVIFVFYLFVIFEFVLFNIFLKNYRFSFFFWLDIISILSLAPEIHLFNKHDELYNFEGRENVYVFYLNKDF